MPDARQCKMHDMQVIQAFASKIPMHVRACVCVYACVRVCVRVRVCVCALTCDRRCSLLKASIFSCSSRQEDARKKSEAQC